MRPSSTAMPMLINMANIHNLQPISVVPQTFAGGRFTYQVRARKMRELLHGKMAPSKLAATPASQS
eukprot:9553717-Prorocentrum_lima.AAC.1